MHNIPYHNRTSRQLCIDQLPHFTGHKSNPSLLHTVGLGLRQQTHRQVKLGEGVEGGRR